MSTPIDISFIRTNLEWTRARLAKEAGVDVSTVCRWEMNGVPQRGSARALLERFQRRADLRASKLSPSKPVGAEQ